MKKLYFLFVMTLMTTLSFAQGVTTASMSGIITDQTDTPLIGASVIAKHTPTGTVYGTITDIDGSYNLSNMKVGGPYTFIVSYIGYSDNQLPSFNLALGEKKRTNAKLLEGGVVLDELMIVAQAGSSGTNSGASTQITEQDIINMPTLGRDLKDFTRLTPQAKESFGGGISLAGQNNRYNAIYIDGAVNNDVFGLASNGQNGGQTGIAPFSIDAVDQIQVVLSPYDVSYGGFAGGGINAVTKSGTNEFKGSAYYFMQNEGLAGKTNGTLLKRIGEDAEGEKLDEFSSTLLGASLGGPIIKDKLFFFVNAEIQKDETPVPFNIEEYEGDTDEAGLNELSQFLRDEYGYEAGTFGSKADRLDGTRIFGKLNYNINKDHNISFRHQYTKGEQLNVNGSGRTSINFENNGVFFPTTTNASAIELSSSFGSKYSNNLIVGYTTVRDDRDPIGQDFPNVRINDGDGQIFFGSEAFSTANALDQNILTITDNFKIYKGDHTFTVGTHNEIISFYNLFIRQNFGAYRFGSVQDFYDGNAFNYDRSYSLVDEITGDGSAAAAEFGAAQFGFYIQDEWNVSSKFTLTGGLRLDVPILQDSPNVDASFNTETLPLLEAQYDLEGTVGGEAPSGQLMFSPRIGANYQLSDKTTIRGGLGIFTSRVPFVWPGGMYTNNGVTIGGLDERDIDGDVKFIADPQAQYTNPNVTIPAGQVDLFASNFKYPQVFRTSLAVDQEFGQGWNFSVEGMYTKTLNNVLYKNVNSDTEVAYNWTNGGDDRPIYTNSRIDDTYTAVYLGTNTNEGYAYNFTTKLDKVFSNGLNLMVAYSVGDAESLIEGTSSQNSSQWRGSFNVDGRNNPMIGRSDFSPGSRLIAGAGYEIDWTNNGLFNTTISAFYNGQSGELYSYVYNNVNLSRESGSTSRERDLIYIPSGADDISLVDITNDAGEVTFSAADQWAALDNFINEDSYLSSNRGEYATRNSNRTPFVHTLDIRILQDIGTNIGGKTNKLQLSLDIFNFGNMINSDWGVQYGNPFAYRILNYQGLEADGTTPTFTFTESDLGNERFGISDRISRWRARVGLRYIFN